MLIRREVSCTDGWQLLFTRAALFHALACSVAASNLLGAITHGSLFLIYRVLLRVLLLISCQASTVLARGYP